MIPTSSAPIECVFYVSGYISCGRRNRLNDENLKREVLVKDNKKRKVAVCFTMVAAVTEDNGTLGGPQLPPFLQRSSFALAPCWYGSLGPGLLFYNIIGIKQTSMADERNEPVSPECVMWCV